MRFTKENMQQLLDNNEGFTVSTYYEGADFRESRDYMISGGNLIVTANGKTSWAGSCYSDKYIYGADDEETKRFLNKYINKLEIAV